MCACVCKWRGRRGQKKRERESKADSPAEPYGWVCGRGSSELKSSLLLKLLSHPGIPQLSTFLDKVQLTRCFNKYILLIQQVRYFKGLK